MCLYVVVYACMLIIYACIITYVCQITLIAVSLGCIHDDVREEPGSWLVVGMIPVFDGKKAKRTGNQTLAIDTSLRTPLATASCTKCS